MKEKTEEAMIKASPKKPYEFAEAVWLTLRQHGIERDKARLIAVAINELARMKGFADLKIEVKEW